MKNAKFLFATGIAAVLAFGCASRPAAPSASKPVGKVATVLPAKARRPADDHMHAEVAEVNCDAFTGWTDKITPAHQKVINNQMGSRAHRLHHALWHFARGGGDVSALHTVVMAFGPTWQEMHPTCPPPAGKWTDPSYDPAGEDFLYMHHQMLNGLRAAFIAAHLPCVRGWDHVPSIQEAPLPDQNTDDPKSPDALARIQGWEMFFKNPDWLRNHSLSQVGWALEFSIHNNLHMRYATTKPPKGFAELAKIGGAPFPENGAYPANWKYDAPGYNWLADPYGAALNPTFWKIHGYVDSMIDLWLKANGFSRIATDCAGDSQCYQWHGTWTGDLNLPESRDIPVAAAPPVAGSAPSELTVDFTQRRMQMQWSGVLQGTPRGAGGPRATPPEDPMDYVTNTHCPTTK